MMQIKAYTPGIYARSEALVQATRDLDRNRTTEEAVEAQRDEDFRAFLDVQRRSGMDYLSDGMLGWQDVLRPFLQTTSGIQPGALTRYLETNTFFRAPFVQGVIEKSRPMEEEFFRLASLSSSEEWIATLPSPLSLASPKDGVSAIDVSEDILLPQLEWLAERVCSVVVLQEPNLFGADGRDRVAELAASLEVLSESELPIAVWLPFGDAAPVLGDLISLNGLSAVGVDFYSTDVADLPDPFPKTLLAGVVDTRNSLLEDPNEISAFIESVSDRVEGEIHLVPNGDLQFVPEKTAREKVRVLGEASETLKGRLQHG